MKRGLTLTELATEIERQQKTKVDFLAPSSKIEMQSDAKVAIKDQGTFAPNQLAHNQIAEKLGIPAPYYRRMLTEDSDLLSQNVNAWLSKTDEVRMVRTLDGKMRCLLSDKYRPMDYMDLAHMAFPALKDLGLQVESSDITDTRLYLKATTPRLRADVKKGQTVQWGLAISNSEVGAGALTLSGYSVVLQCTNGMTHENVFRRNHIGARHEVSEGAERFFQSDTKKATDRALWMQFRDTLTGILTEEHFDGVVQKLRGAFSREMVNPVKTVAVIVQRHGLTQADGDSLFKYLNQSKEFNQNGLVNAVTRYAEDQAEYDRASELEQLGGKLLDLTDGDWQAIESEKMPARRRELVAA